MRTKRIISLFLAVILTLCLAPVQILADELQLVDEGNSSLAENGGYLSGALQSVYKTYKQHNFNGPQGHGFAAETANNFIDRLTGKNAQVVGGDNALHGADRKIFNKNGSVIWIQDKYYKSAIESLNAAFDSNYEYMYLDGDGNPMQLEVPADQYDKVVAEIRERFTNEENKYKINGIDNADDAAALIRKGKYSYDQAVNLTKPGNIDSLTYDAANGVITATCSMGISFVLDFVSCVMNGQSTSDALKESCLNGLKTGGFVFATYVISSQLCRTGLKSALAPTTDAIANALGETLSDSILATVGINTLNKSTGQKLTSKQIADKVSKVLQSQIITEGVVVVALTIPDIIDLFKGRISTEQLLKNLTVTVISTAGGAGGAIGGAALGTAIAPGIGTTIGAVAGGIAGSVGGGALSEWVVSQFLEDDSEKMYEIITTEFKELGEEFILTQEEADNIVSELQGKLTGSVLKDMYASENREVFARNLMKPIFEEEVQMRSQIKVPTEKEVRREMLEELNGIVFLH